MNTHKTTLLQHNDDLDDQQQKERHTVDARGTMRDDWRRMIARTAYAIRNSFNPMALQLESEANMLHVLLPYHFEEMGLMHWRSTRYMFTLHMSPPTYNSPMLKEYGSEWEHPLYPVEARLRGASYKIGLTCRWKLLVTEADRIVESDNTTNTEQEAKATGKAWKIDGRRVVRHEMCVASPGDIFCLTGGIGCRTQAHMSHSALCHEDPHYYGGHYICEGSEKVIQTKFHMRTNYAHVFFVDSADERFNLIQCDYRTMVDRVQRIGSAFHLYLTTTHRDAYMRRAVEFANATPLDQTTCAHPWDDTAASFEEQEATLDEFQFIPPPIVTAQQQQQQQHVGAGVAAHADEANDEIITALLALNKHESITVALHNIDTFNFTLTGFFFLLGVHSRFDMLALICPCVLRPRWSSANGVTRVERLLVKTVSSFLDAQPLITDINLFKLLPLHEQRDWIKSTAGGRRQDSSTQAASSDKAGLHIEWVEHYLKTEECARLRAEIQFAFGDLARIMCLAKKASNRNEDPTTFTPQMVDEFMETRIDGVPRFLLFILVIFRMMKRKSSDAPVATNATVPLTHAAMTSSDAIVEDNNATTMTPMAAMAAKRRAQAAAKRKAASNATYAVTKTSWQLCVERLKKSLVEDFLPNVGSDAHWPTLAAKQRMLADSVRKVFLVYLGIIKPDYKDNMENKRLSCIGPDTAQFYKSLLNGKLKKLQSAISIHTELNQSFLLFDLIEKNFPRNPLQKAVATGVWEVPSSMGKKMTGMTQENAYHSLIASLESGRKITSNLQLQSKVRALQLLDPSQDGIFCKDHTPGDNRAGKDLYLTVGAHTRHGYDAEQLVQVTVNIKRHGIIPLAHFLLSRQHQTSLNDDASFIGEEETSSSFSHHIDDAVEVRIHGDLVGYTQNPLWTLQQLRQTRQQGAIPFDVGITWVGGPKYPGGPLSTPHRSYINILGDIGGYLRPLFDISQMHKLFGIIEESERLGLPPNEVTSWLIDEGVVVYLDLEEIAHNATICPSVVTLEKEEPWRFESPFPSFYGFEAWKTHPQERIENGRDLACQCPLNDLSVQHLMQYRGGEEAWYGVQEIIESNGNDPRAWLLHDREAYACDTSTYKLSEHVRWTCTIPYAFRHQLKETTAVYTHCKISEVLDEGYTTGMIPNKSHINNVRVTFSTGMKAQYASMAPLNAEYRAKPSPFTLLQSRSTLTPTPTADVFRTLGDALADTTPKLVAIDCTPFNNEDGIEEIRPDFAQSYCVGATRVEARINTNVGAMNVKRIKDRTIFAKPSAYFCTGRRASSYDALEDDDDDVIENSNGTTSKPNPGAPRMGAVIHPYHAVIGQVIVGKRVISEQDIQNAVLGEMKRFEMRRAQQALEPVSIDATTIQSDDEYSREVQREYEAIERRIRRDARKFVYWTIDKSVINATHSTHVVTQYVSTVTTAGIHTVKVTMETLRVLEEGNKETTHAGQKGVIGLIQRPENMDFIIAEDGRTPIPIDVKMSAYSMPSRTTSGHMKECLQGDVALHVNGKARTVYGFHDDSFHTLSERLATHGFNYDGKHIVYSGTTGEPSQAHIFAGYIDRAMLKHLTRDKFKSRGVIGTVDIHTRQPSANKRDSGARSGEMEELNMHSHGVTHYAYQCLLTSSDPIIAYVCGICGLFAQPPSFADEYGVSRIVNQRYAKKSRRMDRQMKQGKEDNAVENVEEEKDDNSSSMQIDDNEDVNNASDENAHQCRAFAVRSALRHLDAALKRHHADSGSTTNRTLPRNGYCRVCQQSDSVKAVLMPFNMYRLVYECYAEGIALRLILNNVPFGKSKRGAKMAAAATVGKERQQSDIWFATQVQRLDETSLVDVEASDDADIAQHDISTVENEQDQSSDNLTTRELPWTGTYNPFADINPRLRLAACTEAVRLRAYFEGDSTQQQQHVTPNELVQTTHVVAHGTCPTTNEVLSTHILPWQSGYGPEWAWSTQSLPDPQDWTVERALHRQDDGALDYTSFQPQTAYSPSSPAYVPRTPTYAPPSSPPENNGMITTHPYSPSSPAYIPQSPTYAPSSPTATAYTHNSLPEYHHSLIAGGGDHFVESSMDETTTPSASEMAHAFEIYSRNYHQPFASTVSSLSTTPPSTTQRK